jgi:hypothetical protein
MSMEVWLGLGEILTEYEADDTLSVVVLSGAGDKAFVSGADISRFAKHRNSADSQKEYDRITGIGREKLHSFPNPIIVKIRGFCMGGGLAVAMATDIRIGTPDSQFGIPAAHSVHRGKRPAVGARFQAGDRANAEGREPARYGGNQGHQRYVRQQRRLQGRADSVHGEAVAGVYRAVILNDARGGCTYGLNKFG